MLATVAVLPRLHQDQAQQQQQGREDLANVRPRAPVSVYESSLHAGTGLGMQVLPSESIAVLQENCEGDHLHPHSHEDEGAICPGMGRGTVVVQSSEELQKMLIFGGGLTDTATINFFKLPPEVQDKVCVCERESVCVCVCVLCVCVCIYQIAHNRAIRPCHPSHSMPLALIFPRGDQ